MNIPAFISLVRQEVNDLNAVRWSDPVMFNYYNEARQDMWKRRPYMFFITSILVYYPGDIALVSGAVPNIPIDFTVIWVNAAKEYVKAKCYSEDSEDANLQQLAAAAYQQYMVNGM